VDVNPQRQELQVSNTDHVVNNYIAMWNATDPQRRHELVAQTVTEDATYIDPVMTGEGTDGISTMIAGAQEQFPGHVFSLRSEPDAHHDRLRFSWSLAPVGGRPVAHGTDFAMIAQDGRMQSITGFLEQAS
jgi:SnoaL-like domain